MRPLNKVFMFHFCRIVEEKLTRWLEQLRHHTAEQKASLQTHLTGIQVGTSVTSLQILAFMFLRSSTPIKRTQRRYWNKKVLLRERKRHTDRGISSTPYQVPFPAGGTPHQTWPGGTHPWGGTPPWVPPSLSDLDGVPPPPRLDLPRVPPPRPPPPPQLDLPRVPLLSPG